MMLQRASFWCRAIAVLFCAVVVGCQGEGTDAGFPEQKEGEVEVKGRLLDGGQPASMANYMDGYNYYQITLLPAAGEGKGGTVQVGQDGTFTVIGLSPGKYKVGVAKIVTGTEAEDEWKGKFAADKSKLTVDVTEGQEVTIDVKQL